MQPESKGTLTRLLLVVVGMFGFGFAMVPLYDVLCDVTGFNGKTQGQYVVTEPLEVVEDRVVTIQFLASNNGSMGWDFRPKVRTMKVHPGEMNSTEFYVRNPMKRTMVAQAVPSVTPFHAAEFLHKTECFCFEQQQLKAGEELEMPLRFIIDSDLPDDVQRLTLSYTLFDVTAQYGELAVNQTQSDTR
jgi:cytochrome c oxidase assembly protein subunit 11